MNMENLMSLDKQIIEFLRKISMPIAHTAIFIVFFWFGILKVFGTSPANKLVSDLLSATHLDLFITFHQFFILFGIYEMIIGITFLIPNLERLAIALLVPHMLMTTLPLFFLSSTTWQAPFVPTLEGQYIIKNVVIVALAIAVASHLKPMHQDHASKQ